MLQYSALQYLWQKAQIVLLEAMSAGTVTVASNNPGYESVLKKETRCDIYCKRQDTANLLDVCS